MTSAVDAGYMAQAKPDHSTYSPTTYSRKAASGPAAAGSRWAAGTGMTGAGAAGFQQVFSAVQFGASVEDVPSPTADRREQLRWVAGQLESYFLNQLLARMRSAPIEGGLWGERSFARQIYEEMLDMERAAAMAKAGGIGLADMIYDRLCDDLAL
ncbi:MAG TPA: hypothetical protein GXX29_09330 [Firmicutes bacterium]|nr:hypothetical protein [Bacillota bacterium]